MIFEVSGLWRMGLSLFGVVLVFVGIVTTPIVTIAGFSVIGLTAVLGLRGGVPKPRIWMPELMKSVALGLGAAALIIVTLALLASGGVLFVIGALLGIAVVVAAAVAAIRFLLPTYAVSISTLYNRWVKGKRDYHEALWQTIRGELEQALESLVRYEAKTPDDPNAKSQRAFILLLAGRLTEAAEEANRSLAIATTATGLHARGQVLLAAGDAAIATSDLEEAFRLDPKPWIRASLGAALIEQRLLDAAITLLKPVNRGAFTFPTGTLLLGGAYRLCGRPQEAAKQYRQVTKLTAALMKSYPVNRAEFGWACVHLGRLDEAEEALNSALEHENALVPALEGLAHLACSRSDDDGVLAALERLLTVRPHVVVTTLSDPLMTPLLAQERFRKSLGRATEARDRLRDEVLRRVSGV